MLLFSNDYCDMHEKLEVQIGDDFSPDLVYEEIDDWYDEICNALDVDTEKIVCFAELQRWNGRFSGYNEDIGDNVADCFKALNFDGTISFTLEDGNLVARKTGHDNPVNPSVFIFREVIDEDSCYDAFNAWYKDSDDKYEIMETATRPLGHYIEEAFK